MGILKGFTQSPILLLEMYRFPSHLVQGIYIGNILHTGNLHISGVCTDYVQEKGYYGLLVFIYDFVHLKYIILSYYSG